MNEISIIGLDLAKNVFQAHGARADGAVAFRKKLRRAQVLSFFSAQPTCVVAMEACVRERALLGAGNQRVWPRSEADPANLCETIRQAAKERCL